MCVLSQSHLFIIGNSSDFFGNQASRGGVAYSRRSKIDVNTKSSVMIGNSATETGGAIHLSAANLTFSSGSNTLIQNKALIGGALYASGSIVEVRGQTLVLVNNTVVDNGVSVCSYGKNVTSFGGAVYLNNSQLTFSGVNSMIVGTEQNLVQHCMLVKVSC